MRLPPLPLIVKQSFFSGRPAKLGSLVPTPFICLYLLKEPITPCKRNPYPKSAKGSSRAEPTAFSESCHQSYTLICTKTLRPFCGSPYKDLKSCTGGLRCFETRLLAQAKESVEQVAHATSQGSMQQRIPWVKGSISDPEFCSSGLESIKAGFSV